LEEQAIPLKDNSLDILPVSAIIAEGSEAAGFARLYGNLLRKPQSLTLTFPYQFLPY